MTIQSRAGRSLQALQVLRWLLRTTETMSFRQKMRAPGYEATETVGNLPERIRDPRWGSALTKDPDEPAQSWGLKRV